MQTFLQVSGFDLEGFERKVSSPKNPLLFSRIMPPPRARDLPSSRRKRWIRKHGKGSWQRALEEGEDPGTVQEWKERHWGGTPEGEISLRKGGDYLLYSFRSKGFPHPLVSLLAKENSDLRFLLFNSNEAVLWQGGKELLRISPDVSMRETRKLIQEHQLDDSLAYRLRREAEIIRGQREDLLFGKTLLVRTDEGEEFSLGAEFPLGYAPADLLLQENSPLDDVLLVEQEGLPLWLDLRDNF